MFGPGAVERAKTIPDDSGDAMVSRGVSSHGGGVVLDCLDGFLCSFYFVEQGVTSVTNFFVCPCCCLFDLCTTVIYDLHFTIR